MRPVGSKYLLEEPLGRGATGTVWRGQVRGEEGTAVAVKVLKEELAGDPDVVMRFLRERSVLLRLRHPHIVRVRDLVVEGDLLALVMDLIDGPDLHRYLRENGPFSPVAAALLTAAVADALAASHADGVVHRDLKPANVLLATTRGEDGAERMHPMLTDFGIARLADSPGVTRTHEFVGTPAYVAPESAQGRPQTSAVDIYGAGILLYELVTGRPPFRGDSAIEVLHHHLNDTAAAAPETCRSRCGRSSSAACARSPRSGPAPTASPARCGWSRPASGCTRPRTQAEAALAVGALLAPDEEPTLVEGTGAPAGAGSGDADPTQVLPSGSSVYDPNAATGVLPADSGSGRLRRQHPGAAAHPGRPPGPAAGAGPAPVGVAAQRGPAAQRPDRGPPGRPRERPAAPPPGPPAAAPAAAAAAPARPAGLRRGPPRPAARPGLRLPPAGRPGTGIRLPAAATAAPPAAAAELRPAVRAAAPRARPEPPRGHAPREPRRSANPVKIPGLGCLKGCLTVILVVIVIFVIVWYTTPLPEWVNSTRNLWDASTHWLNTAWDKISAITGDSGGGSHGGG